jgi:hypothetical protein
LGKNERVVNMTISENGKRIGRPPTGITNPVVLATRISPETYEAVNQVCARRGVKPAELIRCALDLLLREANDRYATA